MAYSAELADRVRDQLEGTPTTEKRMFGGLAFLVNGSMAVAAASAGGLMVRADPGDIETHLADGAARMEMRGRELDGWLLLEAHQVEDDASLARWVAVGVTQAESLPPK